MSPPWSVALLRHAEKGRRTSHKQLCGGPQCSVFRVCRRGRSLLCGGQGFGVGNGHAVDVVLDGVEVGVDGDGGAGLGHVLAVVGGVLTLGGQDLALGDVGAEVGVAVGHAGHIVAGVKELELVDVSGDDHVVLDGGHRIGEAAGTVGGGVGLADLQAALDLDVLGGLGGLGGSLRGSGGGLLSLKKRTPARVRGEGLAHFDVRTHLSDNESHYYNIKTQR